MAKSRHRLALNHGPENHYELYKTKHTALATITACGARFSSVKSWHFD